MCLLCGYPSNSVNLQQILVFLYIHVLVCYNYMVEGYYQLCIHLLNNTILTWSHSEVRTRRMIKYSWWYIQWNSSILGIFGLPKSSCYVLGCRKIQKYPHFRVWNRKVSLHTGESWKIPSIYTKSPISGELMYWEFVVQKLFFFE